MIARNPVQPDPPLLTRVEIKVGELMFKNRPVPSHDRATVFLDRYGQYHHLTEQLPLGGGAGYKALFLVNTSVFCLDLQLTLPSLDQASCFAAKVTVTWRITDPVEAAKTNLVDAGPVLRPHVERVLRDISVTYPIEDGTAAERAMTHAFTGGRARQGLRQGVSVLSCTTALTLDASTINYIRRRTEGVRSHEVKKDALRHSAIEQTAEERLAEMKNEHEMQIEAMRHSHQLELDRQRMAMFSGVGQNPESLIAITLAQDPGKAADLLQLVLKQQQAELEDARGVLDVTLKHGLVNRSDVAAIVGRATSAIAQGMAGDGRGASLPRAPRAAGCLEDALTAEVVPEAAAAVYAPLDDDEEDEDDV
ncbi:hypothetical protein [Umezawaea sp.]|uniref:hypothetical protein n=1 Tax=Umezawaea sp. TaxID=1955258 RepID=UPI002ED60F84